MVSSALLTYCLAAASSLAASPAVAFQLPSHGINRQRTVVHATQDDGNDSIDSVVSRRSAVATAISTLPALAILSNANAVDEAKFVQQYDDFTASPEGWSYKEVKVGKEIGGGDLKDGDRVVFDWSGYTIGYFGRPFEAKGGPQGGAFDKDVQYFRTTLGSKNLVPGLECALRTMKPGGIRQVIVPYGPLSYPPEDKEHESVGPKPTTFSGMRALNFVLENPRVDRTLLFNVKLVRVDRGDGKGGYIRG